MKAQIKKIRLQVLLASYYVNFHALSSADFFQNYFFKTILSGTLSANIQVLSVNDLQAGHNISFFPLAIVQWNSIPGSVACWQSLDAFKAAVCKLQHSRP